MENRWPTFAAGMRSFREPEPGRRENDGELLRIADEGVDDDPK